MGGAARVSLGDAQRVKRELLLRSLFPTMPQAAHLRFVELLEDLTLEKDQFAFRRDEPSLFFLFLTEGSVVLEATEGKSRVFSGFSVVGVIDAVLDRPYTRDCRALEPSRALVIRTVDWFDMLEDNAEIARAATRNFATQLHNTWREQAPSLARHSDPPRPFRFPARFENYDKILALREAAFRSRVGMQAIASLAAVAEPVMLNASEVLFDVGSDGQNFFVVAAGRIELTTPAGLRLNHGPGDLVGGPASFCNAIPGYAARAVTDSIVLRISQQDFYDRAEEHPRLLRGMLAFLVSELEVLLAASPS